jgi:HK97 family phage major capsid protein
MLNTKHLSDSLLRGLLSENVKSVQAILGDKFNFCVKQHSHIADVHRATKDIASRLNAFKDEMADSGLTKAEINAGLDAVHELKMALLVTADEELLAKQRAVLDGNDDSTVAKKGLFQNSLQRKNMQFQAKPRLGELVKTMITGEGSIETKASIQIGSNAAGGYTGALTQYPEVVDLMRAKTRTIEAGAQVIQLQGKQTQIAKLLTDPVAGWRAELGAIAAADATFGNILLTAKSLACEVRISREFLQDSTGGPDIIEQALTNAIAAQLDAAVLYGTGASNQPLGLKPQLVTASRFNNLATNGAKLSAFGNYKPLVSAAQKVAQANGNATGAIMSARTLFDLGALADSTGQPLNRPQVLDSVTFYDTNNVSDALTVGTGTTCSDVFVGNWSSLIIGIAEELNIQVLSEKYSGTGEVALIVHVRADVGLLNANNFWIVSGVLPE